MNGNVVTVLADAKGNGLFEFVVGMMNQPGRVDWRSPVKRLDVRHEVSYATWLAFFCPLSSKGGEL